MFVLLELKKMLLPEIKLKERISSFFWPVSSPAATHDFMLTAQSC